MNNCKNVGRRRVVGLVIDGADDGVEGGSQHRYVVIYQCLIDRILQVDRQCGEALLIAP